MQGDEAHHLANVLKAAPGRIVELIDGSGKVWQGVVDAVSSDRVELRQVELVPQKNVSSARITLIQSLCKADKLEWILQKTTELGIASIYLLEADRSAVKFPPDQIKKKLDRWQKIILAAAKQSRRPALPDLHPPKKLASLCSAVNADLKLILSENEDDFTLKHILRESRWHSAAFCIGPEGGWTSREEDTLRTAGFRAASLGANVLRTETAAIVVAAILQHEWGC